jgi:hypothetical protein
LPLMRQNNEFGKSKKKEVWKHYVVQLGVAYSTIGPLTG